jgi:hypothetical protein
VCGTDTGATVLNWLVCEREVSQVVTNHFWLDFNLERGGEREKYRLECGSFGGANRRRARVEEVRLPLKS